MRKLAVFLGILLTTTFLLAETVSSDPYVELANALASFVRAGSLDVGVGNFLYQETSNTSSFSEMLRDEVELALTKSSKFRVISRSRLADLQKEGAFQTMSILTPGTQMPRISVKGISAIVRGRYYCGTDQTTIFAELAQLDGGEISKAKIVVPMHILTTDFLPTPPKAPESAVVVRRVTVTETGHGCAVDSLPAKVKKYSACTVGLADALCKLQERITGVNFLEEAKKSPKVIREVTTWQVGNISLSRYTQVRELMLEDDRLVMSFPQGTLDNSQSFHANNFLSDESITEIEWTRITSYLEARGIRFLRVVHAPHDGSAEVQLRCTFSIADSASGKKVTLLADE